MKITVNDTLLELHHGAIVKDAILKYYTQAGRKMPKRMPHVEDRYGNTVAPDGALTEGNTLFVRSGRKRKDPVLKLLWLISVIGLLTACSSTKHAGTAPEKPVIASAERQAVMFAVNDMHAAIDNFPKLAYIVDSLKTIYPDMLLVGAGDNQTGNPVNDQYPEKGLPMINLMNATGFDLSAVGNHEFDTGPEGFSNLTAKAKFSFICANLEKDPQFDFRISPYKIITLPDGLRLAFLGLVQLGLNGIPDSHPDNVKRFTFRSPFETAREYLWLKDSSDVFIALTHLGFEDDVKLAETMPAGIDLIIGGHSHTKVDKEQVHNGILITQAESKLKYGTLIRLVVDSDGTIHKSMQLIDIRDSKNEKPAIRAMVDRYNDNQVLNEVIATATDDFSSHEELGYLMADAQRAAAGADIALMNPGGVRINHLGKGPVTIKNVYELDPFGNELVVMKLTGEEVFSLLKAAWPVDEKHPVYPSGIRTEAKVGPNGDLEELSVVTEDGAPLDKDKIYSVAMNSYMTQVYEYQHSDPGQSLYFTTAQALIDYLKEQKEIRSYRGEKRIRAIS